MHKVFVLFVQVNSVKEAKAKDHAVTTAYTKIALELRLRALTAQIEADAVAEKDAEG
jgi:hypothetical protein